MAFLTLKMLLFFSMVENRILPKLFHFHGILHSVEGKSTYCHFFSVFEERVTANKLIFSETLVHV